MPENLSELLLPATNNRLLGLSGMPFTFIQYRCFPRGQSDAAQFVRAIGFIFKVQREPCHLVHGRPVERLVLAEECINTASYVHRSTDASLMGFIRSGVLRRG
jgi:hypothetical protein